MGSCLPPACPRVPLVSLCWGQNEPSVCVSGFYSAFPRNQLLSGNIDETCFGALHAKGQTEGLVCSCQCVGSFACEAVMPTWPGPLACLAWVP